MSTDDIAYVAHTIVDAKLSDSSHEDRCCLYRHLTSLFITDPEAYYNACIRFCPELLI